MTTPAVQDVPKLQWHILRVLLPFVVGIYLADYRNLTDASLLFFKIFSLGSTALLFLKSWRQIGIIFSFLALGFWLLYSRQTLFREQQTLQFEHEI